jgi:hypothetical protein
MRRVARLTIGAAAMRKSNYRPTFVFTPAVVRCFANPARRSRVACQSNGGRFVSPKAVNWGRRRSGRLSFHFTLCLYVQYSEEVALFHFKNAFHFNQGVTP